MTRDLTVKVVAKYITKKIVHMTLMIQYALYSSSSIRNIV
jgi:hypothetical protein